MERTVELAISRRRLIASSVTAAAGVAAGPVTLPVPALGAPARQPVPIGAGGTPMTMAQLAAMARRLGGGYPILFCDLAAVDQIMATVTGFARRQGWAVRPALKTFRSPEFVAYLLRRLPEPRGLSSTSSRST